MPSVRDKLQASVRERSAPLAELAQELVRVPTVNPPGANYRECAEILGRRLQAAGFEVAYHRAEGAPGDSDSYPRINLLARRESSRPGPCVHFNSHLDVVPTGEGWSEDPFSGAIRSGRLYGRGSCDMKGGLAASVIAVEAFLATCPDFPGAIELSGTADEETGGYAGVAWLGEQGLISSSSTDHVIIPEPLGSQRVCLGHRGCWWGEIETGGQIAHGCMPFLGDCAVRHMSDVIHAIEYDLQPELATRITPLPVIPEEARRSTVNINSLHGGQAEGGDGFLASCVADSCRMTVDRRFHEPEDLESVEKEMHDLVSRISRMTGGFQWDVRQLWSVPPTATPEDSPVVQATLEGIREVFETEPQLVLSPGTYDQKHFVRAAGIGDCIAYGPGRLEMAHKPNEYIDLADILDSAAVMALALERLLHAERA